MEPDRAEDPLQLKALRMVAGTGDSGGFAAGFALRHEKGRISGPVHSKLFNAHGGSAVLLAWRPVHTSVRSLAGMAAHKRIQPVSYTHLSSRSETISKGRPRAE